LQFFFFFPFLILQREISRFSIVTPFSPSDANALFQILSLSSFTALFKFRPLLLIRSPSPLYSCFLRPIFYSYYFILATLSPFSRFLSIPILVLHVQRTGAFRLFFFPRQHPSPWSSAFSYNSHPPFRSNSSPVHALELLTNLYSSSFSSPIFRPLLPLVIFFSSAEGFVSFNYPPRPHVRSFVPRCGYARKFLLFNIAPP